MADFQGQQADLITLYEGRTAAQLIADGFLAQAQLVVAGVAQYSLNAVDIGFNTAPVAIDPSVSGDALNHGSYSITRDDGGDVPLILLIENVGPGVFRVYVDAIFEDGVSYELGVAGLLSENAEELGVLSSGVFVAFGRGEEAFSEGRLPSPQTDILNAPGVDSIESGMRYDSSGDVANQSGYSYLRKRIVRRISTAVGGFFHLPEYGAGQKLKSLGSGGQVARLQKSVEAQCKLEPDVRTVKVTTSLKGPILRIKVTVTDVDGDSHTINEKIEV